MATTDSSPKIPTALIVAMLLAMLVAMLLSGCKTVRSADTTLTAAHDTVRLVTVRHDAVTIRDSIFVDRHTDGDTVYVTRDRWHTQTALQVIHDTLWAVRQDTLRVTAVKTTEATGNLMRRADAALVLVCIAMLAAAVTFKALSK